MVTTPHPYRLIRLSRVALLLVASAMLFLLARRNALLAHVLIQAWAVLVAWSIYVFSTKSRDYQDDDYLSLLGAGFLAVGVLDGFHALTYEGMGVIARAGVNECTQLWLAARLIEAATLAVAPLLAHRRRLSAWAAVAAAALALGLLGLILGTKLLPVCAVAGAGRTRFALLTQGLICALLLSGLRITWRSRAQVGRQVTYAIMAALALIMLSELMVAFTGGRSVALLEAGHILKVVSYYLIYRGVVIAGLHAPMDQLRRSRALVRAALEATVDGMMVADRQGHEIVSNAKYALLRQALDQEGEAEAVDDEHRRESGAGLFMAIERRARAHPEAVTNDVIALHTGMALEVFSGPFDVDGRPHGRVWCLRDITGRRTAEAEASETRRELMHAARVSMMGQLTASLAHEIRQPLAAILNNAHAGLRFLGRPDADLTEVREILEDIATDDQRAVDIIRNIRAMLRKESPEPTLLDLRDVAEDVLRMARSELDARQVETQFELSDTPCRVTADRTQLQQVVLNLTINAMDAMRDTPLPGRILALRIPPPAEGFATMEFHDHGCGIDDTGLARLFEPFFTTKRDGMGMGLVICHSIIDAHGGKLWATRNPDRGMTFSFRLPLTDPLSASPPRPPLLQSAARRTDCTSRPPVAPPSLNLLERTHEKHRV